MTMVIDEWMKAAMADDAVVAELLVKMKHSTEKSKLSLPQPTFLTWGKRKRRTREAVTSTSADVVSATKRADSEAVAVDSTRCSPTTPLSWNGGASPSGTADGGDESRSPTINAARSKANATSDSASTKKCKRKKTFAELQEEESSLIKERIYLTKEIENIHANYKAQKARSESLKRIKLDMGSKSNNKTNSKPDELLLTDLNQPNKKPDSTPDELLPTNSNQPVEPSSALAGATEDDSHLQAVNSTDVGTESSRRPFLLPDLNLPLLEVDSTSSAE